MHIKLNPSTDHILHKYMNHAHHHRGDGGLDLYTPERHIIPKGALSYKIDLGISCEAFVDVDKDTPSSFLLYPRSSTGSKTPLRLSNSVGVIDSGYRGNIIAMVDNRDLENDFVVEEGTRLFQVCSPILSPISFEIANSLSSTARGNDGFGSTGS